MTTTTGRLARPILLVEDNPDDIELTLYVLKEQGVTEPVVVAKSGADALDKLFGSATRSSLPLPVLVLLDLKLPRISGIEVLRRIRADARTRLLPVVVLTSSLEECDLLDSYGLGANSYVRKPVDFEEFQQAARRISTYWLELNEPPPIPGSSG